MNEVKVSVIIYVKNTIDYIEECIRSVMNQTLQEIEILIIDGGSTDGTLEVIREMGQTDSRIRILHASASVGVQFNLGLKEAKGRYIGICEADDYILPEMYEKQYRIADKYRLDVIRAGYYQVFHIGNKEYRFPLKSCYQGELTEKVVISDKNTFFLEQGVNGFWNGLYRKQFLLDNHIRMNETKGAAYQDVSFSFLSQMYARKIWFMREAFYCYRIDNPNASVNSLHGIELHMKEYEELMGCLKKTNQWKKYKNMFFSWELISCRWFLGELPDDHKMDNAKKIYRFLKVQREEEKYEEKNVMETVRKIAEALRNSEAEFMQCIFSGTENSRALLKFVRNSLEHTERVVVFGAGHMGDILKQYFEMCNKEVLFMDNSTLLQMDGLTGNKVYKPEEITLRYPHEEYIIASISHAIEMKKQLLSLGIQEEHILICDNEEFFLRNIFVKAGQYIEK